MSTIPPDAKPQCQNYSASPFIHPQALIEPGAVIGAGTRVWAWAHVLQGAIIGKECNICDHTFLENDVRLGDRVTIKCGVSVWDGVTIEDDVFIGPSVAFTNDKFPRSKQTLEIYAKTTIKEGASIGANATLLPVTIGKYAMVSAGAVVTRDVPPYAIVVGNPARIVGYVGVEKRKNTPALSAAASENKTPARVIAIAGASDMRGHLSVIDLEKDLPFKVKRVFYTYKVPSHEVRGEHAHKTCHQFLVCLSGSFHVIVDDGINRESFVLDSPNCGLYLPPMIWGIQYKHTADCVLLALASHPYDAADYIRDYDDFMAKVRS
jgi:UDP-2-acetamido-3-amino-2,3-dideoxy-glucuronate N-acetyltransferase